MTFEETSKSQDQAVAELESVNRTLARAELMSLLAGVRLNFAKEAERRIEVDPRVRAEPEELRLILSSSIAQSRAAAYSQLLEAQTWLDLAPRRIESLRRHVEQGEDADG